MGARKVQIRGLFVVGQQIGHTQHFEMTRLTIPARQNTVKRRCIGRYIQRKESDDEIVQLERHPCGTGE
jgi:hypothetical protein